MSFGLGNGLRLVMSKARRCFTKGDYLTVLQHEYFSNLSPNADPLRKYPLLTACLRVHTSSDAVRPH